MAEKTTKQVMNEYIKNLPESRKKVIVDWINSIPIPMDENTVDYLSRMADAGDKRAEILLNQMKRNPKVLGLYRQQVNVTQSKDKGS